MFIRVKQAPCSTFLTELVNFTMDIVSYSVEDSDLDKAIEKLMKKYEELKVILLKPSVKTNMQKFYDLSLDDRKKAYIALCNDSKFHIYINDMNYHLYARELPKIVRARLKDLSQSIYSIIGDSENECTVKFSLMKLKSEYSIINKKHGRVCPICLSEIATIKEEDIDHYFPKSSYPTLYFHPYNILPICKACNSSSYKFKKIPIDINDMGEGELDTVYLPYVRFVKEEVVFKVSEDLKHKIEMIPQDSNNKIVKKRIQNFDRLYQVCDRWTSYLSLAYDVISSEAIENKLDQNNTNQGERLVSLREILYKKSINTIDRKEFAIGIYCKWLYDKKDEDLLNAFESDVLKYRDSSE